MDEAIRDVKAGTKLTKNSFKVEAQGADNSSSAKTEAVVRPGAAAANGAGEDFSITFPEFKKWYVASTLLLLLPLLLRRLRPASYTALMLRYYFYHHYFYYFY